MRKMYMFCSKQWIYKYGKHAFENCFNSFGVLNEVARGL